jgi:hypothetical protein
MEYTREQLETAVKKLYDEGRMDEARTVGAELMKYYEPSGTIGQDNSPTGVGMAVADKIPRNAKLPLKLATESVGGLGALAYDIGSWPVRKMFQKEEDFTSFPASTGLSQFSDAAFGRAEDRPYAKALIAAGAGTGGGVTGAATKAIGPVRGVLSGLSGFIGGEAGGKAAEAAGLPQQVGVIPGSILAGAPMMLPGGGTAPSLAREALKGRSQEEIRAAIMLQNQYPWLRPNQLFPDSAEPLRRLESSVLGSGVGKGTLEARGISQPQSARTLAAGSTARLGEAPRDLMRANEIEGAVERAIDFPRQHANEQARHIYDQLRQARPQLPMDQAFALADDLARVAEKTGVLPRSEAGRAANRVGTQVTENSMILNPDNNKPFAYANRDIMSLDKLLSEVDKKINASYGLTATGADRAKAKGLEAAKDPLRNAVLDNSDDLAEAKDTISRIRATLEGEVRATPLVRGAPTKNTDGVLKPNARWDSLSKMLDEPMSPQDVTRLRVVLDRQDERAFTDITTNLFARKLDDAYAKAGTQGGGALFAQSVREMKNLDAVLMESAKANGLANPQEFVNGFKSALGALEASGRKLPAPGSQDMASILGMNPAGILGRYMVGNELSRTAQMAGAVKGAVSRHQYAKLYSAFDDPQSMQKIADLSKVPIISPRHASLLSSIVGGQVSLATE